MASDYATYLEERYQGEVFGEAAMGAMADVCTNPVQARKLRALEQLERETKELLLPVLREAGGSGQEDPARIAEGKTLGSQMGGTAWLDLMRGMQQQIGPLVEEFERAEALAPADRRDVLRAVTAHERALLEFAARELANPASADSLQPVLALLRTPPDAP